MPSLGADMEAGVLVEWLKQPGDRVKRGDIIAEVETDKGIIEVEVFTDGVIERLHVAPGTKVPVGTPLASIREPSEAPPAAAPVAVPAAAPAAPSVVAPSADATAGVTIATDPEAAKRIAGRLKISPSARRLARELGVDPAGIVGTGPGGAICRQDILDAKGRAPAPAPVPVPADARERMRQAIAAAMTRSKREIPHYYVGTTLDVTETLAWIEERNRFLPVPDRLIPATVFVKAVALALREFPELNARWEDGRVVHNPDINVGPAISLRGGGLVAPALHRTDTLSLVELMRRFRDLVTRARRGSFRSSEMDATITVTNLGDRGTETVYGVIYPPQVAIVGFGRVVERPWVVGSEILPRKVVTITLSADHRVSDGHRGALFLAAVENLLRRPEAL